MYIPSLSLSGISVYSLCTTTPVTLQRNPLGCDIAAFRKEPCVMKTVSALSQPPNDNQTSRDEVVMVE